MICKWQTWSVTVTVTNGKVIFNIPQKLKPIPRFVSLSLVYNYLGYVSVEETTDSYRIFVEDLNDFRTLVTTLSIFVSADAGDAVCLCGAVQEESWSGVWAAGHNQQLRMNETQSVREKNKKKRGVPGHVHSRIPLLVW